MEAGESQTEVACLPAEITAAETQPASAPLMVMVTMAITDPDNEKARDA
jgi:hypothetical protein